MLWLLWIHVMILKMACNAFFYLRILWWVAYHIFCCIDIINEMMWINVSVGKKHWVWLPKYAWGKRGSAFHIRKACHDKKYQTFSNSPHHRRTTTLTEQLLIKKAGSKSRRRRGSSFHQWMNTLVKVQKGSVSCSMLNSRAHIVDKLQLVNMLTVWTLTISFTNPVFIRYW